MNNIIGGQFWQKLLMYSLLWITRFPLKMILKVENTVCSTLYLLPPCDICMSIEFRYPIWSASSILTLAHLRAYPDQTMINFDWEGNQGNEKPLTINCFVRILFWRETVGFLLQYSILKFFKVSTSKAKRPSINGRKGRVLSNSDCPFKGQLLPELRKAFLLMLL